MACSYGLNNLDFSSVEDGLTVKASQSLRTSARNSAPLPDWPSNLESPNQRNVQRREEICLRYLLKGPEIIPMLRDKPGFSCFTEQKPGSLG